MTYLGRIALAVLLADREYTAPGAYTDSIAFHVARLSGNPVRKGWGARMRMMERRGLVARCAIQPGWPYRCCLTEAGEALALEAEAGLQARP